MNDQVAHINWPTVNASDCYNANIPHDIGRNYLRCEVLGNWPTPNTPSGGPKADGSAPQGMNGGKGHREMMAGQFKPGAKLNPSWVEQLMGLPVEWTQLSDCAGTNKNRIDRLRLCGNGVVRQTAAKAFVTLLGRFEK